MSVPVRIMSFATTADFADPGLVETNVIDHKFFWKSTELTSPNGSINLIHAVPANKEIYQAFGNFEDGAYVDFLRAARKQDRACDEEIRDV